MNLVNSNESRIISPLNKGDLSDWNRTVGNSNNMLAQDGIRTQERILIDQ